jgi:putative endonuclease
VPRPAHPHALQRANASQADQRRALGRLGEELAATHLQKLGFSIVARNVRARQGEIDLVAADAHTLLFVEIKCRRARARHPPPDATLEALASLRFGQRTRIRRLAAAWLRDPCRPRLPARAIRFDAIGVLVDGGGALVHLEHVEGAW